MVQPFIGEIRMFGGTFAPNGWAFCNGQLVNVVDNETLFSLIGSVYGGNGRTTFALPDLRGRLPLHQGQGAGLTDRRIGAKGGSETAAAEIPSHRHTLQVSQDSGNSPNPVGNLPAVAPVNVYSNAAPADAFAGNAIQNTGGGASHNNLMPFLVINFIIALTGLAPSEE